MLYAVCARMWMLITVLLFFVSHSVDSQPVQTSARCQQPKLLGRRCPRRNIEGRFTRWYFNADVNECVSFAFAGCGGNENNFVAKDDCEVTCKPADSMVCSGNSQPRGLCSESNPCAIGLMCVSSTFNSYCCDADTEKRFRLGHRPQCAFGVYHLSSSGITYPLQADSCAELDCPKGYTCERGEVWVHCCAEAPRTPIRPVAPTEVDTASFVEQPQSVVAGISAPAPFKTPGGGQNTALVGTFRGFPDIRCNSPPPPTYRGVARPLQTVEQFRYIYQNNLCVRFFNVALGTVNQYFRTMNECILSCGRRSK